MHTFGVNYSYRVPLLQGEHAIVIHVFSFSTLIQDFILLLKRSMVVLIQKQQPSFLKSMSKTDTPETCGTFFSGSKSPFTLLDTTKNVHIANEQEQLRCFMRNRELQSFPTANLMDVHFLAKIHFIQVSNSNINSFLEL